MATLPNGWSEKTSRSSGDTYYMNDITGERTGSLCTTAVVNHRYVAGESTFDFPQFEALPEGWETRESRTTGASPAPRAATCAGGFRRRLPRDGA